jgi:murein DD-endopeptidase MepM/ murein hydrolase activator NlpD
VDGDRNLNYIIGATQYDPYVSPSPPYKWFIIHNLGTTFEVIAEGNMNGPINDLDSNDDASLLAFGSDAGEVILLRRVSDSIETVYNFNVERLIDSIEIGTNTFLVGGENFVHLYLHEFPRFPVDNPLEGSYWYHYPGSGEEFNYIPGPGRIGHFPSGGFRGADDTYALDLNWGPRADSDLGKPVYAIERGVIKELNRIWGWVLIEHKTPLYWRGRIHDTWYSGYLHMQNIPSTLKEGGLVEKSTKIGEVGREMARSPHLHFAIYVGRVVDPSEPGFKQSRQNAFLESVDPGLVGGPEYAKYTYGDLETVYKWGRGAIYNHNVDEITAQDPKHWFEKGGSDSDWFESTTYGFYGHMFYTHTNRTSVDNWGRWNHEVLADGTYKIYVFIPRNYADTLRAKYQVFCNGILIKETIVNQERKYDEWVWLGDFNFKTGDKIQVFLNDNTGERNRLVAYDTVKIWAKQDLYLPRDD